MNTSAFSRIRFSSDSITKVAGDSIIIICEQSAPSTLDDVVHISRAENLALQETCRILFDSGSSNDASVTLTPLGKLQHKYLITSAVPSWKGGGWDEDVSLTKSLKTSLLRSTEKGSKNVLISTEGLASCGFPSNRHIRIAVGQTHMFLTANEDVSITFLCKEAQSAYRRECSRQRRLLNDSEAMKRIQMPPLGVQCTPGSIVNIRTDAVVNAANTELRGGGGVDGAIHRAAGPLLAKACRDLGGCASGDAVVTDGYGLKASYIIHTVGPIWSGGTLEEDEILASCYMCSLEKAVGLNCGSIAFPAISCGVYGFPQGRAVKIAVRAVQMFKKLTWCDIKVYFSCYEPVMMSLYQNELKRAWNEVQNAEDV